MELSQKIDAILNEFMDEFEKDTSQSQANNTLLCSYMEKFESGKLNSTLLAST